VDGGETAGEAGAPQVPALGLDGAGAPPHPGDGGETIVGATGLAPAGGAQVAATPAVWLAGAAGRTGGADFFLRLWRALRNRTPATRAASARRMYAYSTGMRWRASLSPRRAIDQLLKALFA
jgi:hypothetical protein